MWIVWHRAMHFSSTDNNSYESKNKKKQNERKHFCDFVQLNKKD